MNELVQEGLILMAAGMGAVVCFLSLMVVSMQGMAAVVQKIAPPKKMTKSTSTVSNDLSKIAVAIAVVKAHTRD